MYDYEEFVFPEPWWDRRSTGYREGEVRNRLVHRLRLEIGKDHELADRTIEAVATFTRQDEVLYRVDRREFLIAHLTYTPTPPDPFVRLRRFTSWEDTAAMIHEMAEMW